ncbi:hypothetical protein NWF34_09900 [Gordonia sp. GONU]|uniref:hypothetical protein n=1 Tax=Gordonia sp. GONU TaxID=2972949 RepID=UPI0021AC1797|nr:hypothetical protein [Gordonia sp. GONU]MCR8897260.1 hypothetical protein [Gordonia sp. GONU]
MMTEDTITEKQAWTEFSGNARMVKRDKELGYTMRMMAKPIPKDFGECTHSPKWGVEPVPTPPGYAWAAETFSRGASSLHLVPLTPLDEDEAKAQNSEWAEPGDRKVASVCDRRSQSVWGWSRRWHRTEGKLECATCLKLARAQTLPGMGGAV